MNFPNVRSVTQITNVGSNAHGTNGTVTPKVVVMATVPVVQIVATITGLDFTKLSANPTAMKAAEDGVKTAFLASMSGYTKNDLKVGFTKGSVVATVQITPKAGTSIAALTSSVKAAKSTVVQATVANIKKVVAADPTILEAGATIGATAADPVVAKEEKDARLQKLIKKNDWLMLSQTSKTKAWQMLDKASKQSTKAKRILSKTLKAAWKANEAMKMIGFKTHEFTSAVAEAEEHFQKADAFIDTLPASLIPKLKNKLDHMKKEAAQSLQSFDPSKEPFNAWSQQSATLETFWETVNK